MMDSESFGPLNTTMDIFELIAKVSIMLLKNDGLRVTWTREYYDGLFEPTAKVFGLFNEMMDF